MAEIETAIKELMDKLAEAELKGDASFLDQNLTDEFVGIGPRGFVLTKSGWVGRHRSKELRYASLRTDEVVVRLPGDETAVVTGRETSSPVYQGNSMPESEFRIMEVFVRQKSKSNEWRLAAKQMSPILPPPKSQA